MIDFTNEFYQRVKEEFNPGLSMILQTEVRKLPNCVIQLE